MNKTVYLDNINGAVESIFTLGNRYDIVYFKFKAAPKPIPIGLSEFIALISELQQVAFSIESEQYNSYDQKIKLLEELSRNLDKEDG